MKPEITTLRQKVGSCPVCHCLLWAEVDVAVALGDPYLNSQDKVVVACEPVLRGMRVAHECAKDESGYVA